MIRFWNCKNVRLLHVVYTVRSIVCAELSVDMTIASLHSPPVRVFPVTTTQADTIVRLHLELIRVRGSCRGLRLSGLILEFMGVS